MKKTPKKYKNKINNDKKKFLEIGGYTREERKENIYLNIHTHTRSFDEYVIFAIK